jgi:hypothetical protein
MRRHGKSWRENNTCLIVVWYNKNEVDTLTNSLIFIRYTQDANKPFSRLVMKYIQTLLSVGLMYGEASAACTAIKVKTTDPVIVYYTDCHTHKQNQPFTAKSRDFVTIPNISTNSTLKINAEGDEDKFQLFDSSKMVPASGLSISCKGGKFGECTVEE